MKTLDEVIETAPYVGTEWTNDALHYLKEYRSDKAMWEADRKGHLDWIEQYKEAREKHQQAVIELKKNPPLTWDELRTMEGKPVWYEHEFWKGWIILGKVEQGVNCEMIPDREEKWYIVKDGSEKAYRKER